MSEEHGPEKDNDKTRFEECREAASKGYIPYQITLFQNADSVRSEGLPQTDIITALTSIKEFPDGVLMFEGDWQAGGHFGDLCEQLFHRQSLPDLDIEGQRDAIHQALIEEVAHFVFRAGGPKR